ncbi:MAG: 4a-hydroxytetrahydrobiopterin dehydratase [Candidatus Reconcilbacillus cellulovorans]|uniref:Putative pterin-4-alpha-carbinolamine dehydratase n=1 Tax=Candidatus Reconcilbacillus cellulovorans TaxID=1906605 RepID=A0A2A6E1W0_9BACL|nr:MAG: 4a-hydroxytetrahydrobiopterin dehydratase [Candidatus Reconcilbacillus cellulovorans]
MPRLADDEIAERLRGLPGWSREGDRIAKTFRFPTFMDAIRFVNRVAECAEAANHHPDIDIRYRRVRLSLTTHDEGGITEKDVTLAERVESLVADP